MNSKHICIPLLQLDGWACAQAPVGNAAMSGAPIIVSPNGSKIFKNLDMRAPFQNGCIVASAARYSN
jgi:hypothetical protein